MMDTEHGNADSYEFINERDATSIRSDSGDLSSLDSGIPLSEKEIALAKHVRRLKQENKELRSAIDNYQEAVQLCQENLNNMIIRQEEIQYDALQKYNQAKTKVQRQNEKISSLEKQLEEEKIKYSKQEVPEIEADQKQNEIDEKVDVSEKNTLKENISCIQKVITALSSLSQDEGKTSLTPDVLQDLISLSKSIKPLITVDSENDNALADELKSVKEKLQEQGEKCAELTLKNNELHDIVNSTGKKGVGVIEVQEELKLLNKDMDEIDMIRAGLVSRDSQTTEETSYVEQEEREISQSVDTSLTLKLETENQKLREKIDNLRSVLSNNERAYLKEKEALKQHVAELQSEIRETQAALGEKADISQLAEAIASKSEIQLELSGLKVQYEAMEKNLCEAVAFKKKLETQMGENDLQLRQELKMRENVEGELKAQVYSFYKDLQAKELECDNWKARMEQFESECRKMGSALEEMRTELAAVYSENEKLLTGRKTVSGAELGECQSKIDNLTAQLLSAEEMLEHKEQDLRKLHEKFAGELETLPLLKQQCDVFRADFHTERQTRQKFEEDNRKLRDEVAKLQTMNERLIDEASDPTGSKLAEMQRRHGMQAGNENNHWGGFYDKFLAPRGNVTGVRTNYGANPQPGPLDNDMNRQVSGGRCPKCDRMFPDLDTLQTHVVECLESESTGSVGGVICPKCQDSFPDLDTLQIHVMECLDN